MGVREAVDRELSLMDSRLAGASESVEAEAARALAADLDSGSTSATARALSVKQLRETLDALRARVPAEEKGDKLDDLKAQREKRRGRRADSAPAPSA